MKKTISTILCIILITTICLVSCNQQNNIQKISINENGELIAEYQDGTQENLGKVKNDKCIISNYINDTGELIVIYSDQTQENLGMISCENVWRERNDTVYVLCPTRAYKDTENHSSSEAIFTAEIGTPIKRIATNGKYNKVLINGQELYMSALYSTTNQNEVIFEENLKIVYPQKENLTIYRFPQIIAFAESPVTIPQDTEIIMLGINKTGTFAKIKYKDIIFYCQPTDITETKPNQETNTTKTPVTSNPITIT